MGLPYRKRPGDGLGLDRTFFTPASTTDCLLDVTPRATAGERARGASDGVADAGVEGDRNTSVLSGEEPLSRGDGSPTGLATGCGESDEGPPVGVSDSLLTSCRIVSIVVLDPPTEVLTANAGTKV